MSGIATIGELIERLEAVRADLRPHDLDSYQQVGWAQRPLDALLDQAREEAEALTAEGKPVLVMRPLAKCGVKR